MMKKLFAIVLAVVFLSGCTSETQFGHCIGAFDDKEPDLKYRVEPINLMMGIVFVETIFVPAIVVLSETHCPIGKKNESQPNSNL